MILLWLILVVEVWSVSNLENGELEQLVSLPLGAVRMTHQFLQSPERLFHSARWKLSLHVKDSIHESDFNSKSLAKPVIGLGGAFVVARSVLEGAVSSLKKQSDPVLDTAKLADLLNDICGLTSKERAQLRAYQLSVQISCLLQ